MKTQTVYVATDGRQFNNAQQCRDHEERLFDAWLKSQPTFSSFLSVADVNPERRQVVREYWEHVTVPKT